MSDQNYSRRSLLTNSILAGSGLLAASSSPAQTSTTQASRGIPNVDDFGADPTGDTFSTQAFNDALAICGVVQCGSVNSTYKVGQLTLPAGFSRFTFMGASGTQNNTPETRATTTIKTYGNSFAISSNSVLFSATNLCFESANYQGTCFGTSLSGSSEIGFYFRNITFKQFDKAFYTSGNSSSSYAYDCTVIDCNYGIWAEQTSSNSRVENLQLIRVARGCQIYGDPVYISGGQVGYGYNGPNSYDAYIGYHFLNGHVYIDSIYSESYGQSASKNIMFSFCSALWADSRYYINNCPMSTASGLTHLQIYSENPAFATKDNLITIVNSSETNDCPTIKTIPTQTGLIRGVKFNGRTFSSKSGIAIFDSYDLTANITTGTAKAVAGFAAFGTNLIPMIGFDKSSILGFSDIINNSASGPAAGQIYFGSPDYSFCPVKSVNKTVSTYEISGEIAMDNLTSGGDFCLAICYKNADNKFVFKQIGIFKALGVPGSTVFNMSAAFCVAVEAQAATNIGIGFVPSAGVRTPTSIEITSKLYGRLRCKFINFVN